MITVVSPTAFKINQHALAIEKTCGALPVPNQGLLISPGPPTIPFSGRWEKLDAQWIPRGEWNTAEYSRFMLQGLVDYIDTDVCVTAHWDGYGVNKDRWQDDFLNYDYIGAPWPASMNSARVGNGGFSLRSKRWLKATADLVSGWYYRGQPEDDWACRTQRAFFFSQGLRIAPLAVAAAFSIEHPVAEFPNRTLRDTLGFHGAFTPETKALVL